MGVAEALGHGHSRHSTIKSYIIFSPTAKREN